MRCRLGLARLGARFATGPHAVAAFGPVVLASTVPVGVATLFAAVPAGTR